MTIRCSNAELGVDRKNSWLRYWLRLKEFTKAYLSSKYSITSFKRPPMDTQNMIS